MATDPELPDRMVAWRIHAGLTQEKIGKHAGLTKQAVSYIETGTRDITVGRLNLICRKALKITIGEFFTTMPGK